MAAKSIELRTLKDCLQFLEWLKNTYQMQSQVARELATRFDTSYNNISFTGKLPAPFSEFLTNVSTFYHKLASNATAGNYRNNTAKDVTAALLECTPKLLAALYFLLYHVDEKLGAVGGGDWADKYPGYEETWQAWYNSYADYGGKLQSYLRSHRSMHFDVITGGFNEGEVRYNDSYNGYVQGKNMVSDLERILSNKSGHNDFRDVFVTTVMSDAGTKKVNTANVFALVKLFCEIVGAKQYEPDGGELKIALEKGLTQPKNCINWNELKSHCSTLDTKLETFFNDNAFSYTGQAPSIQLVNQLDFANRTAQWFRDKLDKVRKNVEKIKTNYPTDRSTWLTQLQPFATTNIFPYGFIFGDKSYGTLGDAWKILPKKWPNTILMLRKEKDGLDRLRELLEGEGCKPPPAPPQPPQASGSVAPTGSGARGGGGRRGEKQGRGTPSGVRGRDASARGPSGAARSNPRQVQSSQHTRTTGDRGQTRPSGQPASPVTKAAAAKTTTTKTEATKTEAAKPITKTEATSPQGGKADGTPSQAEKVESSQNQNNGQSGGKPSNSSATTSSSSPHPGGTGAAGPAGPKGGTGTQGPTSTGSTTSTPKHTAKSPQSPSPPQPEPPHPPTPPKTPAAPASPGKPSSRGGSTNGGGGAGPKAGATQAPGQPPTTGDTSHVAPSSGDISSNSGQGSSGADQQDGKDRSSQDSAPGLLPVASPQPALSQPPSAPPLGPPLSSVPAPGGGSGPGDQTTSSGTTQQNGRGTPQSSTTAATTTSAGPGTGAGGNGDGAGGVGGSRVKALSPEEQKLLKYYEQLLDGKNDFFKKRDEAKKKEAKKWEAKLANLEESNYKILAEQNLQQRNLRNKFGNHDPSHLLNQPIRPTIGPSSQSARGRHGHGKPYFVPRGTDATQRDTNTPIDIFESSAVVEDVSSDPMFAVDSIPSFTITGQELPDRFQAFRDGEVEFKSQEAFRTIYNDNEKRLYKANLDGFEPLENGQKVDWDDAVTEMTKLDGAILRDYSHIKTQSNYVNKIENDIANALAKKKQNDEQREKAIEQMQKELEDKRRNDEEDWKQRQLMSNAIDLQKKHKDLFGGADVDLIMRDFRIEDNDHLPHSDVNLHISTRSLPPPLDLSDPVDPDDDQNVNLNDDNIASEVFHKAVDVTFDDPFSVPAPKVAGISRVPPNPDDFKTRKLNVPLFSDVTKCQNPWYVAPSSASVTSPTPSTSPDTDHLPPPKTIRGMLYWFVRLNQYGLIGFITEHVEGLLKGYNTDAFEVTGDPTELDASMVAAKLTETCLYAASVIYRIKYKDSFDAYETFFKDQDKYAFYYSPDPACLLCQLRDYAYACHYQLEFLKSQCSRDKSHGGWKNDEYGNAVKMPSPLQAFLTDGWDSDFKTHPFDPCNLCLKSRVRMGFTDKDLPSSHQTGATLSTILSPSCGGSDPLLTLCSYLNCLTRRTPRTTGELVSYFHNIGDLLHDAFYGRLLQLGTALSTLHPNCPDWDHLGRHDLGAVRGIRGHESFIYKSNSKHDHPGTLSTLVGCGSDPNNCRPRVSPITYRAYTLYSQRFAHTYLSWTVYLPDLLWESLYKLYYDLLKHCGSGKCTSLYSCTKAMPLLYLHGFTPPEGTSQLTLRCKQVIFKLQEIVNGGPIASLMTSMDNFLYGIREPFIFTLIALWSLAFLIFANTMLYRLDVLYIRSHLIRTKASHHIDVKALLTKGRKMLSLYKDVDYFDEDPIGYIGV